MRNDKSKTKKAVLIGLSAAVAYSFIKGNGVFNKPRFYQQHKAVQKYLSSNHESAYVGEIVKTKGGWSCIVNDMGRKFVLNMEKTSDGSYVFSETVFSDGV